MSEREASAPEKMETNLEDKNNSEKKGKKKGKAREVVAMASAPMLNDEEKVLMAALFGIEPSHLTPSDKRNDNPDGKPKGEPDGNGMGGKPAADGDAPKE